MGVVLAVIGGLAVFSLLNAARQNGGSNSTGDASGTAYRVSLPRSADGGRLSLEEDLSDKPDYRNPELGPGGSQYVGWYASESGAERYLFVGYNSTAAEDGSSAAKMLDGAVEAADTDTPPKRHHLTPAGSQEPLTCLVLPRAEGGAGAVTPVCAWDDKGSAATVSDGGERAAEADQPADYDVEGFAEKVDRIRRDLRKPAE
ncbi:hypothetical protein ABZ686_12380 [Streptomyces sp. NPDC006992]|uniref:hypothetical protein n=1 Tax=unclassified Streptomyces TaxID=2593676 RepID=UPI0033DB0B8A